MGITCPAGGSPAPGTKPTWLQAASQRQSQLCLWPLNSRVPQPQVRVGWGCLALTPGMSHEVAFLAPRGLLGVGLLAQEGGGLYRHGGTSLEGGGLHGGSPLFRI